MDEACGGDASDHAARQWLQVNWLPANTRLLRRMMAMCSTGCISASTPVTWIAHPFLLNVVPAWIGEHANRPGPLPVPHGAWACATEWWEYQTTLQGWLAQLDCMMQVQLPVSSVTTPLLDPEEKFSALARSRGR